MTVHLVNLTNPMMMKGPIRELLAVDGQTIHLRLPEGKTARRARLLAADQTLRVVHGRSGLTFKTPPILDHEILAIDFT